MGIAGAQGPHVVAAGDQRFFVITAARTGSTLLSAILGDAGADFGLPTPTDWDRSGGELEHPELWRALRYFRSADAISTGRPRVGFARMRWNACRSLGKRRLRRALDAARYVKVYGGHELVRRAFKLGYFPTVILSYRRFEDQARSFGLMHAHATWESLRENYRHIYGNGLWLLDTFGGCVVSYEMLVDRRETAWAEPLSRVTGLSAERLLAARDRRCDGPSRTVELAVDPAMDRIHATIDVLKGKVIPPSDQALRSWRARAAHLTAGQSMIAPSELTQFRPSRESGTPG